MRGFTLIEIMAVLVLSALVAGLAAVSLMSPRWQANNAQMVARIKYLDQLARQRARLSGHARIFEISLDLSQIGVIDPAVSRGADFDTNIRVALPDGFSIRQVRRIDMQTTQGTVTVPIATSGCSSTYAINIETAHGQRLWIVFLGLSGQSLEIQDDKEVADLFAKLSSARPNAS